MMGIRKIPKHIWLGVMLPLVLLALGLWRIWPLVEDHRAKEERKVMRMLLDLCLQTGPDTSTPGVVTMPWWFGDPATTKPVDFQLTVVSASDLQSDLPKPDYSPTHGYYFVAIKNELPLDRDLGESQTLAVPQNSGSTSIQINYCAYPAIYDWRHRRTIFVAEDYYGWRLFVIDNGGKPIVRWSKTPIHPLEIDLITASDYGY